jgi:hypothetical protein
METYLIEHLGIMTFIVVPIICAILTSMITEVLNSRTPKVFHAFYIVAIISFILSFAMSKIFPTYLSDIWIKWIFIMTNFFFTIGFYDKGGRKFIKWAFESSWLKSLVNLKLKDDKTETNVESKEE